jgi:hypothetical protein
LSRSLYLPTRAVDGEDVTVGRDDQAELAVQEMAPGDGDAATGAEAAEHRVGDGGDPVAQRVGDVQHAVRAEAGTGQNSGGMLP